MNTKTLTVESIVPLSSVQLDSLKSMVKASTPITVENKITPDLLGGMRLSFNGKVLDFSLKARIIDLRSTLS
jgi:F0F1-type ATP synthase delta subunit